MQILLYVLIGGFIGVGIVYAILSPKLKITQKLNENIALENSKLETSNYNLKISNFALNNELTQLTTKRDDIASEIERINNSLLSTKEQAEETANIVYKKTIEAMQEKLSNAADEESKKFTFAKEEYEKQYLQLLEDSSEAYKFVINNYESKIDDLILQLDDLKSKAVAAVEAHKRAEEMKEKENFFKLQLSDVDIEEIKKLRSVTPYLRNSEPLNKVIWKVYYENPTTDLLGRVVGKGVYTGIYKLTNTKNNMCYVGQAVDIASRWKQHIKRGIGAETPTRNKLYPAMLEFGVENFTFEIIEMCEKEKLNEREQYWQDYFKAKEFGYSIK